MKKTIYINAGHWDNPLTPQIEDPGAVHNGYVEAKETMRIRDATVPILRERGYVVHVVPDHLNLNQSIEWVNSIAKNLDDGIALDIHLNAHSNTTIRGTEAFHGTGEVTKKIASLLSEHVAEAIGTTNRGAKPDTQTHVGSLGWIRRTTPYAVLLEVCFITNAEDMSKLIYPKVGNGIADALDAFYGVPKDTPEVEIRRLLERALALLPQLDK